MARQRKTNFQLFIYLSILKFMNLLFSSIKSSELLFRMKDETETGFGIVFLQQLSKMQIKARGQTGYFTLPVHEIDIRKSFHLIFLSAIQMET